MTPVFEGPPMILRLVVFGKPTGFGCEFKKDVFFGGGKDLNLRTEQGFFVG